VTTEDLQVAGAMAVTLKETIAPTLMQTLEGVPTLIHAGPFANIAHGNSSIIADQIALKLSSYVVTEAGFGSDMGFEKACNIKASAAGRAPDCVVIVATLRGLKANSGHYDLRPGMAIPDSIFNPDQAALEAGFENLKWHINNVHKYGIPAVVAINQFPQDSQQELAALKALIHEFNPEVKVAVSTAFGQGGEGAVELAQHVVETCEQASDFRPLYRKEQTLKEKLMAVCEAGYGAANIEMSELATQQLKHFEQLGFDELAVCIAKTPLSITTDSAIKGAPSGFSVPIRELRLCAGAGFVYALSGNVMTMPGLPDKPAFMNLDLDDQGNIIGLS
jgi:formate--tetrahydrofolate ligase